MYRIILVLIISFFGQTLVAQQFGQFESKINKAGLGKLKNSKKSVYIAKFNINYEVYKSSSDFSHGGATFGGGVRGDASAKAAVGLQGIQEDDIQANTDLLYKEYIDELQAAGLDIITAGEAGNTAAYEGWELKQGGTINKSQYPGVLTARPTGFEYFVKRVTKKGKEKTGFVQNYGALSKELGNAIIAEIDLIVMFSENGKQYFNIGGVAKTKIKTNLRLVDSYTITAPKKTIMKGGGVSTQLVQSKVGFYSGKVGMASTTTFIGTLKKPYEINDVIPEEKIKAVSSPVAIPTRLDQG